jgi:hypothetical protein
MERPCTKRVNHSYVKVEENKRKAVFRNPNNVEYDVTTIDNCLITNGIRSDYLVSEVGSISILIELKGYDVAHACEQLLATVRRSEVRPYLEKRVGFLVVCRKYPRFDTFVAKAKQRCARDLKAGFHVVCDKGEFDIDQVAAINGRL